MPRSEYQPGYGEQAGREKLAAAMQTLEEGIDSILGSEDFGRYLAVMSRFHSYPFVNSILVAFSVLMRVECPATGSGRSLRTMPVRPFLEKHASDEQSAPRNGANGVRSPRLGLELAAQVVWMWILGREELLSVV
jgi:hypothetical protein